MVWDFLLVIINVKWYGSELLSLLARIPITKYIATYSTSTIVQRIYNLLSEKSKKNLFKSIKKVLQIFFCT